VHHKIVKARRAKCLIYLVSKRRSTGFRHFYQLEARQLSFFTSVEQLGLSDHSLRIAAAQVALANLMDLSSITLPQEVVIEGIELNRGALQFWENTARNLEAERLVEDNLPAHVLGTRWRSRSSLRGRIEPRSESVRRKRLIAMSGGKKGSTASARHESGEVFPPLSAGRGDYWCGRLSVREHSLVNIVSGWKSAKMLSLHDREGVDASGSRLFHS
jgi:hypothetical protein